jgi:hypothetical protein
MTYFLMMAHYDVGHILETIDHKDRATGLQKYLFRNL